MKKENSIKQSENFTMNKSSESSNGDKNIKQAAYSPIYPQIMPDLSEKKDRKFGNSCNQVSQEL